MHRIVIGLAVVTSLSVCVLIFGRPTPTVGLAEEERQLDETQHDEVLKDTPDTYLASSTADIELESVEVPAVAVDESVQAEEETENDTLHIPEVQPEIVESEPEVPAVTSPPVVISPEVIDDPELISELATEIHRLTNEIRTDRGIPALSYDDTLGTIALGHSEDMAAKGFFSHENLDGCALTCRFEAESFSARAWAENIIYLENHYLLDTKETAQRMVESWMGSGGHRENILNPNYTHEGIGIAYDGKTIYVTADFAELK